MKTKNDLANLLNKLPHHIQVFFVLHCCNDIKHLLTDERSLSALNITEKWLQNSALVTPQELYNATNAAYYAGDHAAAYAAHAADAAAYAANAAANAAAYAANAASNAADAAAYAANAAAYAANAASNATNAAYNATGVATYAVAYAAAYAAASNKKYHEQIDQYYNDLCIIIRDMTDLEKSFLDIEIKDLT